MVEQTWVALGAVRPSSETLDTSTLRMDARANRGGNQLGAFETADASRVGRADEDHRGDRAKRRRTDAFVQSLHDANETRDGEDQQQSLQRDNNHDSQPGTFARAPIDTTYNAVDSMGRRGRNDVRHTSDNRNCASDPGVRVPGAFPWMGNAKPKLSAAQSGIGNSDKEHSQLQPVDISKPGVALCCLGHVRDDASRGGAAQPSNCSGDDAVRPIQRDASDAGMHQHDQHHQSQRDPDNQQISGILRKHTHVLLSISETEAFIAVGVKCFVLVNYPDALQMPLCDQFVLCESVRVQLWRCYQAIAEGKCCHALWPWHRFRLRLVDGKWQWDKASKQSRQLRTEADQTEDKTTRGCDHRCSKSSPGIKHWLEKVEEATKAVTFGSPEGLASDATREQLCAAEVELSRHRLLHAETCRLMGALLLALQVATNKDKRKQVQSELRFHDTLFMNNEQWGVLRPRSIAYLPLNFGDFSKCTEVDFLRKSNSKTTAAKLATIAEQRVLVDLGVRCELFDSMEGIYCKVAHIDRVLSGFMQISLLKDYELFCEVQENSPHILGSFLAVDLYRLLIGGGIQLQCMGHYLPESKAGCKSAQALTAIMHAVIWRSSTGDLPLCLHEVETRLRVMDCVFEWIGIRSTAPAQTKFHLKRSSLLCALKRDCVLFYQNRQNRQPNQARTQLAGAPHEADSEDGEEVFVELPDDAEQILADAIGCARSHIYRICGDVVTGETCGATSTECKALVLERFSIDAHQVALHVACELYLHQLPLQHKEPTLVSPDKCQVKESSPSPTAQEHALHVTGACVQLLASTWNPGVGVSGTKRITGQSVFSKATTAEACLRYSQKVRINELFGTSSRINCFGGTNIKKFVQTIRRRLAAEKFELACSRHNATNLCYDDRPKSGGEVYLWLKMQYHVYHSYENLSVRVHWEDLLEYDKQVYLNERTLATIRCNRGCVDRLIACMQPANGSWNVVLLTQQDWTCDEIKSGVFLQWLRKQGIDATPSRCAICTESRPETKTQHGWYTANWELVRLSGADRADRANRSNGSSKHILRPLRQRNFSSSHVQSKHAESRGNLPLYMQSMSSDLLSFRKLEVLLLDSADVPDDITHAAISVLCDQKYPVLHLAHCFKEVCRAFMCAATRNATRNATRAFAQCILRVSETAADVGNTDSGCCFFHINRMLVMDFRREDYHTPACWPTCRHLTEQCSTKQAAERIFSGEDYSVFSLFRIIDNSRPRSETRSNSSNPTPLKPSTYCWYKDKVAFEPIYKALDLIFRAHLDELKQCLKARLTPKGPLSVQEQTRICRAIWPLPHIFQRLNRQSPWIQTAQMRIKEALGMSQSVGLQWITQMIQSHCAPLLL